jgi:hypothetical protein
MSKASMKVTVSGIDFVRHVKWGPYTLPPRYRASFDFVDRPFLVEIEVAVTTSGFACREVTFTARHGGEALEGSELRVPITGMIRHSLPRLAMASSGEPDKWRQIGNQDELDAFYAAFRRYERKGGREPITTTRLREVARIYKANQRSGQPSTAVANTLGYSQSYARNLVGRARKAGMLPPARKETK